MNIQGMQATWKLLGFTSLDGAQCRDSSRDQEREVMGPSITDMPGGQSVGKELQCSASIA